MKFLSFLEPFYYEFLAKFVPKKVNYNLSGDCIKCAKCCRYLHCKGLGSEAEFMFLQFLYPEYKNFRIAGKDIENNFVLVCKLIDKNNHCPIYKNRPSICQNYPNSKANPKGILHKNCGFLIKPEKSFKDFLKTYFFGYNKTE